MGPVFVGYRKFVGKLKGELLMEFEISSEQTQLLEKILAPL